MKCVVEVGAGVMICILSFMKAGSGIQKLMGGIHRDTYKEIGDLISILLFFQNKECRLKI
jgi:hypothetical protein